MTKILTIGQKARLVDQMTARFRTTISRELGDVQIHAGDAITCNYSCEIYFDSVDDGVQVKFVAPSGGRDH